MHDFTYILSLTSPVFILMALGYTVVRAEWLAKDAVRTLAWFVVYIGLPAAMFKALSSRSFQDILHYDYLIAYGIGSMVPFVALFALSRLRGRGLTESSIMGLGGSISNSLMIGFPIIMQLFGDAALVPFALTLIIENLVVLPLALALADTGQKENMRFLRALMHSFPQLMKNPIILSMALGMLSSIFNVQPPAAAGRVIDMLAATVGGVALFTIGGMLVGIKPRGMIGDLSAVVIGKLLIHPLGVFLAFMLLPSIPPLYATVAVVLACMPMFSVYAVLGARYGLGGICSAVLLPTTLVSFVTINTVIWLIGVG